MKRIRSIGVIRDLAEEGIFPWDPKIVCEIKLFAILQNEAMFEGFR